MRINPEKIEACIDAFYAAAADRGHWESAVDRAQHLLGGHSSLLFTHELPSGAAEALWVGRALPPDSLASYESYYAATDLWVQGVVRSCRRTNTVMVGDQLVAREVFDASEWYNDFLRHYDIYHLLTTSLFDRRAHPSVYFSIYRHRGGESFDQQTCRAFRTLVPHIQRALVIRNSLWRTHDTNRTLEAGLNALCQPVFIVDGRRRVEFLNRAAEQEVSGESELAIRAGRLIMRTGDSPAHLERLLVRATRSRGREGAVAEFRDSSGHRRQILISPLTTEPSGRAIVLISERSRARDDDLDMLLRELFRLSRAEIRLCTALLDDLSLPELADLSGVSRHTLRSQLKSVFLKTGCSKQTALMRLLMSLPRTHIGQRQDES